MFDIGWSEMLFIAIVAIMVIGPKDLPKVLRTVGQWTGRARAMAREFQNSLDDAIRETELDEIKKDVEKAADLGDIKGEIENSIDPSGTLDGAFEFDDLPPPPEDKSESDEEAESSSDEWSKPAAPPHSISPPDEAEAGAPANDSKTDETRDDKPAVAKSSASG